MALFYTDGTNLKYADLEAAIAWWRNAFDAAPDRTVEWDSTPGAALILPGSEQVGVGLYTSGEPSPTVPVIFTPNIQRAHAHLEKRGIAAGPIQGDSPKYFEIRDCENNLIEISEEP